MNDMIEEAFDYNAEQIRDLRSQLFSFRSNLSIYLRQKGWVEDEYGMWSKGVYNKCTDTEALDVEALMYE